MAVDKAQMEKVAGILQQGAQNIANRDTGQPVQGGSSGGDEAAASGYALAMGGAGGRKSLDESIRGAKKKGGRIKKTGIYRLHKGEFVVPAHIVQRLDKQRKGSRKSGRR